MLRANSTDIWGKKRMDLSKDTNGIGGDGYVIADGRKTLVEIAERYLLDGLSGETNSALAKLAESNDGRALLKYASERATDMLLMLSRSQEQLMIETLSETIDEVREKFMQRLIDRLTIEGASGS